MYHAVYRCVFFVLLCMCNSLKLYGDVGLCNGFHAVDRGSNPLGDATDYKRLKQNLNRYPQGLAQGIALKKAA